MALRPLRHRRPHPAGLLRDPHQRDRRHRRRVLATGRGLLRPLRGIACERVLTNNGPCYRSSDFANTLKDTRTSPVEGPDRHGCDSTPLLDGVSAVGRGPQTGPVRNSVSPLDSVSCRYRCDGCLCKTPTNPFYGNHTAQPLPADSGLRTSPTGAGSVRYAVRKCPER